MKIAFGIFGFIRIDIFKNEWLKFLEIFKNKDIIIDMYICVPTILNEFDDNDNVDFEYIKKTLLKEKIINNVYIKEYIYNANTFIKKSKEYNYVFKTPDHYLYPYRILSLFSSISNLSNEIIKSNIEYDFIILSRFDMLSLIKSIGNDIEKYKEKGSMYCIRNEKSLMFFEDRFTITHKDGLIILSQLYETFNNIVDINNIPFISEIIIYNYLNNFNDKLKLYRQDNIIIEPNNMYIIKYTDEFTSKITNIYNNYS